MGYNVVNMLLSWSLKKKQNKATTKSASLKRREVQLFIQMTLDTLENDEIQLFYDLLFMPLLQIEWAEMRCLAGCVQAPGPWFARA